MNISTSLSETEMALKSESERLNLMTTEDSRTNDSDEVKFADNGKGKELEIHQTESAPAMIQRERSPTPSMLTRRRTEEGAIKNGQKSAGYVDKKARFDERKNGGKIEKKDSVKRRHSSNEHANVYTECGRHSNDWLFGGLSLSGVVKKIWQKDGKDSG
ncbi:hypothetical protein EYC84_009813 [Monilinia fructicola]|uniref:Uncharacterized protein n=1 Tax=Monilinia fructicola TaxID=38448 RepID=A0A5M9JCC0_MONFR|nr:hypothetical protein EYC84_009813 [Monilinia fructicola]